VWTTPRVKSATASASRSQASACACRADISVVGHTGVTTVTRSSMLSKIAITVGRMNTASGRPRRSVFFSGSRSTSRTMS
jgi:hypothetical protein